jgi:hypothetical protein
MTAAPSPAEPGRPLLAAAVDIGGAALWDELLHDWQLRSEHDGGYSLLRCRVCGTELVR